MRVSATILISGLAVLIGASAWLELGLLLPIVGRDSVSYYFCSASPWTLALSIALAAGVLAAFFRLVGDRRCLYPLPLIATNLLALPVLDERIGDIWAPVAYLAIDLRWPLALTGVALSLWSARPHWPRASLARWWSARSAAHRSLLTDVLLATMVVAFAVATTPRMRFGAMTIGDEPKYIRFAENWYQGKGLQIDRFVNVNQLPPEENRPNLLGNLAHVAPALRENAATLVTDLASLRDPANWWRRYNRAESADNHVIRGKNGWHYQIHSPGLSALLLPSYVIDRQLFDRGTSMFADDMFTTNLVLLMIYAALVVVVYRMTVAAGARAWPAAIAAGVLITSLPVTAFPFQFYPETTAALITCAVVRRMLSGRSLTHRSAMAIALALTLLGWLHIRFLIVAGGCLLWMWWFFRHHRRAPLLTLGVTFSCGMLTLCAYAYHLTGSMLPSAPFALGVGSGFVWDHVPVGLVAMLLDQMYGLLPLAPVYLLAVAGAGLMARRNPVVLTMIGTIAMGLIVPSAGQGYWTDGSTPLRHALAVLPLAAIPLALWLDVRGARPFTMAAALLLIAISLRTAVAYNLQNDKTVTTMLDAGFAGWDISLLFPITRRVRANPFSMDAWLMMLTVVGVLAVFAYGALSADTPKPARTPLSHAAAFAVVCIAVALVGGVAIGLGTSAHRWELLRGFRRLPAAVDSCWIQIGAPPPRGY